MYYRSDKVRKRGRIRRNGSVYQSGPWDAIEEGGSDNGKPELLEREDIRVKRIGFCLLGLLLVLAFGGSATAHATDADSIVIAVGQEVPTDDGLPEGYGFPEGYQENAVQFVTEDGVVLCGYVLGTGSRGITLGHAKGWGLKSWLPFGERLAEEGYQVILWEFRDTAPSGPSAAGMGQRWDLDVLAAAQVLRERGATRILSMGASYGGTATAVAAAEIPELAGVAILSSPAYDMEIDAIGAIGSVTAPAFFAVSREDWQNAPGVYQEHVEALYEACGSDQKEIHIVEGSDHGTDMITVPAEGELGYAVPPKTQEGRKAREELADELMRFVKEAFGEDMPAGSPGAAGSSGTYRDGDTGSVMPSEGNIQGRFLETLTAGPVLGNQLFEFVAILKESICGILFQFGQNGR